MGTGQICTPDTAIAETLDAVKIFYDKAIDAKKTIGIACAIKNAGVGMGLADIGRASLRVENGRVVLYTAALCIGQGLVTAMVQIAARDQHRTAQYRLYFGHRCNYRIPTDSYFWRSSASSCITPERSITAPHAE